MKKIKIIFLIVLISLFFRFYNYENRWGLAYDQAHDALVARHALLENKIPLLGPFSSAGPFQTGGEWYWFIMLGTALFPYWVLTPWIFLTLSSVMFVILMYYFGKEFVNEKFGLILSSFTAISTAQITQSTNLTNQFPLAIISLFAIWSMVRYVRTRKEKYFFFLSLSAALGATIHLQGVPLLALIVVTIFITGIPKRKTLLFLLFGILIPLLPILFFDIKNDFINTKGMFTYYFIDQYKISLDVFGRRWLTYAGVFWPTEWARIIGGQKILGYFAIAFLSIGLSFQFLKERLTKEWYVLIISFLAMIAIVRYVRTPLFPSYIVFLHPFVLIFTTWIVFGLLKINKFIGFFLIITFLLGSGLSTINEINNATNDTAKRANHWKDLLTSTYPGKKFAIYDYNYKSAAYSLPLVLFLEVEGKLDDNGYRIGFGNPSYLDRLSLKEIIGNKMGFELWDLDINSSQTIKNEKWSLVNPSEIYKATEEWYTKK